MYHTGLRFFYSELSAFLNLHIQNPIIYITNTLPSYFSTFLVY